jgi:hypothetical protein
MSLINALIIWLVSSLTAVYADTNVSVLSELVSSFCSSHNINYVSVKNDVLLAKELTRNRMPPSARGTLVAVYYAAGDQRNLPQIFQSRMLNVFVNSDAAGTCFNASTDCNATTVISRRKLDLIEAVNSELEGDTWLVQMNEEEAGDVQKFLEGVPLDFDDDFFLFADAVNGSQTSFVISEAYRTGPNAPYKVVPYGSWNASTGLVTSKLEKVGRY